MPNFITNFWVMTGKSADSMKILFRADASVQIGSGHVMRCLTLAVALRERGAQAAFVCREHEGNLCELIEDLGFPVARLPSGKTSSWLGEDWETDAFQTMKAMKALGKPDWLVVDHYSIDSKWESKLREMTGRIMVIDDLADRTHDCDLILDQNLYADMETRYAGKVPAHCQQLLGPRYALLRDEFRRLHEQVKLRSGVVRRVLVFFGGMDIDNYTSHAIEAIAQLGMPGVHVDVVIGAQHPHRELIETACAEHGFSCHVQTSKMAELMAAADLSIGAGGSTIWERCCLGLPTLAICTADNQKQQIKDAAREGLLYSPDPYGELPSVIKRHVIALTENSSLRYALSLNGMQAVDGQGTPRVIGNMGCNSIEIRRAKQDDSNRLFEWRNHPNIRAVSRITDPIDWESHRKWFASVLSDPDRLLLIGERDNSPMGVVRFDIRGNETEISIYLDPSFKQTGQGRELLQSAERWLEINRPDLCKINAHVLGGNARSIHLFSGAGYQLESTCYSKRLH